MFKSANVTIMVRDMKRSIAFYTEAVGFTAGKQYGEEWADIEAPGLKIGLHPSKDKAPKDPKINNLSIGLQVDDLDEAMKTLSSRGVKFHDVHQDRGARFAYFADPDGAPLYLIELKW